MSALELEPDNECCICFGNLQNRSNIKLRCTHHFCLKCMILHLNQKNNCPLCRGAVLPTNDYKVIFEGNQKLAQKLDISRRCFTELRTFYNVLHSENEKNPYISKKLSILKK